MRRFSMAFLGITLVSLPLSMGICYGADQFQGDSAIYGAGTAYVRPNVLLIIDNSKAAANTASGSPYDPNTTYDGSNPHYIYEADQQGDFRKVVAANTTSTLEELSCSNNNDIIKTTLLQSGTYTGSGTTDYPSLTNNAECSIGNNKGATYALGNYLNYLASPPAEAEAEAMSSQVALVYESLATVLNGARYAVNFGAMVYGSSNKGGMVVSEVADLSDDTDFQAFLNKLPGSGHADAAVLLTSETARPQAEALYDAGSYFRGESLPISAQTAMTSPITDWCGKNYVILVTNGLSNKDDDTALGINVGDYDADGMEGAPYGAGTHYLDDVAKFNYEEDASNLEGTQRINTHTILAFQNEDPLVKRAADGSHGRGSFYNVFNANELAEALTKLLANIVFEADTAFVAPVVPISPENRTYSGDRIYLGFFKPISQKPWRGNLKKYGLGNQAQLLDINGAVATNSDGSFKDTAISYWSTASDGGDVEEGGVGGVLLNRNFSTTPRSIYTYRGSNADLAHSSNAFNATNISASDLGLASDSDRDSLVNYIYGYDAYDEDGDGVTMEKRSWILGDILHSKPLILNYNTYTFNAANEGNSSINKTVVFVGTNDGMLHAFRDSDGKELWAFVPPNLLPELQNLSDVTHSYFVDASPVVAVYDKDKDGNIGASEGADGDSDDGTADRVILLIGQRRGGHAYYALDVTDPATPKYLWKIDNATAGFSELGESWSTPVLGKVKDGTATKVVAFVGAGYDNENEDRRFGNTQYFTGEVSSPLSIAEGVVTSAGDATTPAVSSKGRGVLAFEVATYDGNGVPTIATSPSLVWEFTPATTNSIHLHDTYNRGLLSAGYSFPSDVAALDSDNDGYVDRLYLSDTGGRVWRISAYNYTGEYRPKVDPDINNWFGKIIFSANTGSSDIGRKNFSKLSVTRESQYSGIYFGTGDRAHPLNRAVTDRLYGLFDRGQSTSSSITETNLVDVTLDELQDSDPDNDAAILTNLASTSKYGWYIKLNENSGEKVLAPALVLHGVAYFTTYAPSTTVSADPCDVGNLGTARLYAVDYKTGSAIMNYDSTNDSDSSVLRRSDRSLILGQGIPSEVVVFRKKGQAFSKGLVRTSDGPVAQDLITKDLIHNIYWLQQ